MSHCGLFVFLLFEEQSQCKAHISCWSGPMQPRWACRTALTEKPLTELLRNLSQKASETSLLFFGSLHFLCRLLFHKRKDVVRKMKRKTNMPPPHSASLENKPTLLFSLNSFVSRTIHQRPHICLLGFACLNPKSCEWENKKNERGHANCSCFNLQLLWPRPLQSTPPCNLFLFPSLHLKLNSCSCRWC